METTNKQSYFSDNRNIAKVGTGLALGAAALYGLSFLIPFLNTLVWETTHFIAGLGVLGILLFFGNRIIKVLPILNAKLAKMMTFWIIAWDEFIIQEMAINQAEKDRQVIKEQGDALRGQVAQKENELEEANNAYNEAKALAQHLKFEERRADDDPELALQVNEYTRQEDFINSITPLKNNIEELANMCKKVYDSTGIKIKDARAELKLQKSKLASLTAGEKAMSKALSIFTGKSPELEMAEQRVKEIIGAKIGSIRNSVDIIKPMMDERALKDRVRVKNALSKLSLASGESANPVAINLTNVKPFDFLNKK